MYLYCIELSCFQGMQTFLRNGDEGDSQRMFTRGVDSLYRIKVYHGEWVDGTREGMGVLTYVNNDTVEAMFVNGQPHGVGLYKFFKTKKTRKAKFVNGYRVEWLSEVDRKKRLSSFQMPSKVKPSSSSSPSKPLIIK